jgi:hypothetical protein
MTLLMIFFAISSCAAAITCICSYVDMCRTQLGQSNKYDMRVYIVLWIITLVFFFGGILTIFIVE